MSGAWIFILGFDSSGQIGWLCPKGHAKGRRPAGPYHYLSLKIISSDSRVVNPLLIDVSLEFDFLQCQKWYFSAVTNRTSFPSILIEVKYTGKVVLSSLRIVLNCLGEIVLLSEPH